MLSGILSMPTVMLADVGLVWLALPVTVVLGVVIVLAGLYNGLVVVSVRMRNAFSQIDVQLRRRHDLVPNLVEAVRGYMTHERSTLEAVTRARAAAQMAADAAGSRDAASMRTLAAASGVLDGALRGLMARIEAYPELRASGSVRSLQEELVSTENRIAFARQAFNDAVMRHNERVATFPSNLVAGVFGFRLADPWMTEAETRAVPGVRLGSTP